MYLFDWFFVLYGFTIILNISLSSFSFYHFRSDKPSWFILKFGCILSYLYLSQFLFFSRYFMWDCLKQFRFTKVSERFVASERSNGHLSMLSSTESVEERVFEDTRRWRVREVWIYSTGQAISTAPPQNI